MSLRLDVNTKSLGERLRVYPILDPAFMSQAYGHMASSYVGALLRGGATAIQLRQKGERYGQLAELALRIRTLVQRAGALLIINNHVDMAIDLGADGVHLGLSDCPIAVARAKSKALIIGASAHTVEQGQRALDAGADYLSLGPIWGTPSKPEAAKPAGLAGIGRFRAEFPHTPLVVIGGIRPSHTAAVRKAGADGVAFISALGSEPEATVKSFSTTYGKSE